MSTPRQVFYSPAFRWIGRQRGEVSAAMAALSLVDLLWGQAQPIYLFEPRGGARVTAGWGLLLAGVALRLWAAGHLRKHAEVTMTGIYRMVRHPLYVATALLYLACLLCFGDALVGVGLCAAMLAVVYGPRILHEEVVLHRRFPAAMACYRHIPRLLPDLRALPAALQSDRFSLSWAYHHLGVRSVGALLLVPLLLEALVQFKRMS
jgi:protein-S-isoprenylcysteine O-methyltransferase Ste14